MSMARGGTWGDADLMRVQQKANPRQSDHAAGGILALDLASVTGWAYGTIDDYEPLTGIWRLARNEGLGAKCASLENEITDAIALYRPRLVVMEAPMELYAQAAKHGTNAAAKQQYALAGHCESACWRARVECQEADVNPVRMAVMGRCKWPKGETKPAIVAWCRRQGWISISDHNASDAAVLWQFSCDKLRANARGTRRSAAA